MSSAPSVAFLLLACSACATSPKSQAATAPAAPKPAPEVKKQHLFADVAYGVGTYKDDIDGGPSGDTDGQYLMLRAEYVFDRGIGAGIALEGTESDDDLFSDFGSPDAKSGTGDVFLYCVGVPVDSKQFRLPIRLGPYFHDVEFKEDSSDTKINWDGVGIRAEVEPEYWLIQKDGFWFGFVGDLSAGVHVTSIDAKDLGVSENFDGNGTTFGGGIGVQARFADHVTTRLGYVYRTTREAESDDKNGAFIVGNDVSFSGIALQVGVRF